MMTSIFLWIFDHYKSKDQVKAFQRSAIGQFFFGARGLNPNSARLLLLHVERILAIEAKT